MKKPATTPFYQFDTTSKYPNQRSCDCVVRSISLCAGKPWVEVFVALVAVARQMYRMPNEQAVYEKYLASLGYVKMPAPRHDGNHKYEARQFVKMLRVNAVVHVGGHHLSCFKDGKIHDIWDCGAGSVGNYWVHKDSVEANKQ